VLELARRCKNLQALVFASAGCSIYDRKNPLPLKEEYPVTLVHDTPYQISKMTGEMYCYFYQQHYGVPAVVFRFFNSFGPGEVPGRYRNVIPNFVWWAMHGQPLPVLGTGRETRDYIFVEDLVAGLMAGAFTAGVAGEAFNLGTGRETAVMDLAERVNTLVGNAAGITRGPRRDWDRCEKKAGDFSKARRLLGWEPRVAFDDGLERTVAWFRRHREQIAAAHDGLPAEQRLVLEVARLEHSRCTG
jgi:nucleoside-diphosphate-sugar epimerase